MSRPAPPGDRFALFLDFDGTLVDIAPTPDAVKVEPWLPAALTSLRATLGGALAIVTGRTVAALDEFLPGLRIDACGLHGLERRIGGELIDAEGLPDLSVQIDALRRRFASRPGVIVEDKRIGVALHWRLAPDAEAEASSALAELAERLGHGYRIQDGKAVREIVPAGAGKGTGIEAAMRHPPYAGRQPAFAGDDRTDESGFVAVNALGGVSVKIGSGPTEARHRLGTPTEFRARLRRWSTSGFTVTDLPSS